MRTRARLWKRLQRWTLGPEIALPEGLARDLLPPAVSVRAGRWIPVIGGVLGRMRGPAAAVTLRRTIVVHPGARLTRRLLRHELAHVRQWEEDPLFPLRYTAETLRRGYTENRYEREARSAETAASFTPEHLA